MPINLKLQARLPPIISFNSLLALESLVGLLGIIKPAGVVNRDLIARSGRVGAVATGNNLALDTHIDDYLIIVELGLIDGGQWWMGGRLKTRGNADSQFFLRSGGAGGKSGWAQC